MFDNEDFEEGKTIAKALYKAIKTFYKELEKAGMDGAFYPLKIEIFELSYDFNDIMEVLSWDNLGSTVARHQILKVVKEVKNETK